MKMTSPPVVDAHENSPLRWLRAWHQFWFAPGDPTTLGLVRICLGMIVLYVHLVYTLDLQEFMGEHAWLDLKLANAFRHDVPWGIMPNSWEERSTYLPEPQDEAEREYVNQYKAQWGTDPRLAYVKGNCNWSLWFHVTDPYWMNVAHFSIIGIMFLFTIGFCTRITSVLTWLSALSYIHRSPTTVFGMDAIMSVMLFYLMIGPSGAALSVDRLISRYWLTWRSLRRHRPAPALRPQPLVMANVALRLLQVHLCIIYFMSGTSKLLGSAWWNGTALWGTLANYEFARMDNPIYMTTLHFLCDNRWLWEIVMTSGVVFTLVLEIGFPFLVWNPRLRGPMVLFAVILHLGIAIFMQLFTFSLIMATLAMSFVPGATVRRLINQLFRGAESFRLSIIGAAPRQLRLASLVHAFDVGEQVEITDAADVVSVEESHPLETAITTKPAVAAQKKPPLQLIDSKGAVFTGYALFERTVRSLRLLWPLALLTWIPGIGGLGRSFFPERSRREMKPARERREAVA